MEKKKSREFLVVVLAERPGPRGLVVGPIGAFVAKISGSVEEYLNKNVMSAEEGLIESNARSLWALQKGDDTGEYIYGDESVGLLLDELYNEDEK